MDPEIRELQAPWNVAPKTIEEMVNACAAQGEWEKENGPALRHWCIIITRSVMEEMCQRLLAIETKLDGVK